MDVAEESKCWELSKENIQPLRQGRKETVLSVALDESASQALNITRHAFEEELRTYSGDDPLDVWYRYCLWTEQNYPKGGKEGNIIKIVHMCLKDIHASDEKREKYKNDPRMLDIWIKCANVSASPIECYQTLEAKGLFTSLAEFYISWSWEIEKIGNYKRADNIYQKGIQLGAKPADVLHEAHKKFQMRVARSTMEGMLEGNELNTEPHRAVLTSLKPQGRNNRVGYERVGSSVLGPAGRISQDQPIKNAGGPAFSIFQDSNTSTGHHHDSRIDDKGGVLPIEATINQENVKKPGLWTKNKVQQKAIKVVPVEDLNKYNKPAFSLHKDETALQYVVATPAKLPQTSNVLSIRNNEFKDWNVALFIPEPFDPNVQPQYCKHKVYCGTEEFSFEELKAANYFKIQREKEKVKYDELILMRERIKEQDRMIKQLLQGCSQQKHAQATQMRQMPELVVNSPETHMKCLLKKRKREQNVENTSHSIYQDSWIAINKSVNASANASHFLDESSTSALLQCQPATAGVGNKDSSITNILTPVSYGVSSAGQDNSNLSSGGNSRVLNVTETTVNTKLAWNMINDMWSTSLFHGDLQQDTFGSVINRVDFIQCLFILFSQDGNNGQGNVKPSQPFAVFEDMKDTDDNTDCKALDPNDQYMEDQDENRPPPGLVQQQEHRQITGILQPSANIPILPLDQCPQEDMEINKKDSKCGFSGANGVSDNDDIEGIVPLDGLSMADFTMKIPNNEDAFAKMANVASTPSPWTLVKVPQATVIGEDFTMAVMKAFNHFPLIEDDEKIDENEVKKKESEDLMPPPTIQPPPVLSPCPAIKTGLSPIMEASREYRSSSSSSSGYSTTSTTLGGHSVHGLTQHGGFSISTQMSRSRHYSNSQPEYTLESATAQTDFTKSGYFADKSRGESLADSRTDILASQNPVREEEKDYFMFDPQQAAAMLMDMDDMMPASLAESTRLESKGSVILTMNEKTNLQDKINPFADEVLQCVLSSLKDPVETRSGFVTLQGNLPVIKPNFQIALGSEMFHVRRIRGEGAYAKVFQASTMDPMNVTILPTDDDFEDENDEHQMILKVQKPACPWEFYICHELRNRLKSCAYTANMLDSVMRINRGYFFTNGSILVNQYHKYGTLLDVVNGYKTAGKSIPEEIAMYFIIEVLSVLEALHSCSIIHADVKPDNFLIREIPKINKSATTPAEMFAECPVSLKLIDFGRSIDMKRFPQGTTFTEKVTTEGFTCCEMRDGQPWTYQTDLYGVAAIAHCLLFGNYMEIVKLPNSKWNIKNPVFKRYWQKDLWQMLFSTLLNVPSCSAIPSLTQLKEKFMETFFKTEQQKEINVKFNTLLCIVTQRR
ncbi:LOW QUALITY PROTEIN: mitotic checkpoint serine/threonine-protein kinase BUB1 [Procambarus clarkii]|uniref:LOW QUALITY PROTEIN: mitotic checkpoint serine/threonine-protein kinase BUB1 n=1 Tax=Procambarus clarkii TaxID=6728 RepID=UPI0037433740